MNNWNRSNRLNRYIQIDYKLIYGPWKSASLTLTVLQQTLTLITDCRSQRAKVCLHPAVENIKQAWDCHVQGMTTKVTQKAHSCLWCAISMRTKRKKYLRWWQIVFCGLKDASCHPEGGTRDCQKGCDAFTSEDQGRDRRGNESSWPS